MKRFSILFFLTISVLSAQTTISPPVVWGTGSRAKSDVLVQNSGVLPLVAMVDASSFQFVNGKPTATPLQAGVKVELSETSFRIGAKQSKSVHYVLTCEKTCWGFVSISSIAGKTSSGVVVKVVMPQVFYLCKTGTKGDCRAYVRKNFLGNPDNK